MTPVSRKLVAKGDKIKYSDRTLYVGFGVDLCEKFNGQSQVTGQLVDTSTRGLPTRGLDNSQMLPATLRA